MQADAWYPDCWASIGAMAAVTQRLRFSVAVYVLPLRNPFEVARATGTLAILSGNRFILGAGTGWMKEEFDIYGVDFKSRGKRFDEYLDVLRLLWRGGMVEYHGQHFDFPALQISPAPQAPVPIFLGGAAPVALERAARKADGWIGAGNLPEEVPALARGVHAAAQGGRTRPPALRDRDRSQDTARSRDVSAPRVRGDDGRCELPLFIHRRHPLATRAQARGDGRIRGAHHPALRLEARAPMTKPAQLSTLGLPPIAQIGHVVRDLQATVTRYEPLYGPFWFMDGSVTGASYRGRIADVSLDIAFGRSGDLEIELIQWKSVRVPIASSSRAAAKGYITCSSASTTATAGSSACGRWATSSSGTRTGARTRASAISNGR
jgi:probable F420-dependent oxidoreductase